MLFLMFPCWCLALPPRGGVAGHRVTRQLIARFLGGDWESLHREHIARCRSPPHTSPQTEAHTQGPLSTRRALHLGRSGELSRAARALVPSPLAPGNHATVAALRELHPASPGPLPSFVEEFQPKDPFVLDRDCFVRAVRASPSHSSAGVFGGVFEHYRDVLDPADPASGFDLFFHLASRVALGDIPASVARMLGTSRLVALQKPSGGVRPLAVGEGFYRLVSRAICLQIREDLSSHFQWQFGFAFRGGCEVANLGVRLLLESSPTWGVIQVDVKNAFNTIHRRVIFEELRAAGGVLGGIFPFVRTFYGASSPLFFSTSRLGGVSGDGVGGSGEGDDGRDGLGLGSDGHRLDGCGTMRDEDGGCEEVVVELESATGTRQGDPLGGVLFALGHQQALRATAAAFPDCAFPSIADDTHIVGPPARVVEAFSHFVLQLALLGLSVQPPKCVAWSPSGFGVFPVLPEGVSYVTEGIRLLGVPLGTEEYVGGFLSSALEEDRCGLDQLQHLGDPQVAIRILTQVFAQRPSYLLRSCPPTPAFLEGLRDYDSALWQTLLVDILGGVPLLSEEELRQPASQARLPVAQGGVGLLSTAVLAPIAFLGSFALAAPALQSAFQQHGESLGPIVRDVELGALPTHCALRAARNELDPKAREVLPPFDALVSTPPPRLQATLHAATYAARFEEVLAGAGSSGSQARIRSTSGAGAGHWLQATPILPSLHFPAPLFVTALRLRLGLPHPCLATYAACSCGHPLDPLGTHLLRCARGGERTSSHDSVRDAVYHIIRESRQHAQRERTGFLPSSAPGGRGGRVDIVISDAAVGHTLVDIVVADPTRQDLVERAARHDLVAATDAERRKETHYRDRAAGTKFVPFALETYGALSDRSDRFLVECATLASRESVGSGPSISLLCTWFRQRVSIALQRSLAHAIHARTLRLEQSMALLPPPPPRVPLSSSELHIVASFG